jgi:hypothetical protein
MKKSYRNVSFRSKLVIANIPNGQAAQALVYVPEAVPTESGGTASLQPLGRAGAAAHFVWLRRERRLPAPCPCSTKGSLRCCRRRSSGLSPASLYARADVQRGRHRAD